MFANNTIKNVKEKPQNYRKYLKIIYLIRELYQEYI